MKNNKLLLVVFITIIAVIAGIVITRNGQTQSRNVQQPKKIEKIEDDAPTVDLNAPEPSNLQEKEIRKQRGKKYKKRATLDKMEDQSVVFENPSSNAVKEPAFPVEQSDIIIIGTVTDSQAFVSDDKTAVYSEFQVTVGQVLKNDKKFSITSESNIVAERIGGRVRFPSGKIQRWGESAHDLPQKNKQYVLFLKWNEEGKDYSILTGYKVEGQNVNLLDGLRDNARIFSKYKRLENTDLTEFLSKLQAAIANPSLGEMQ